MVFQVGGFSFSSGVVQVQVKLLTMMVVLRNVVVSSDSDSDPLLLWLQRTMLLKKMLPYLMANLIYIIKLLLQVYLYIAGSEFCFQAPYNSAALIPQLIRILENPHAIWVLQYFSSQISKLKSKEIWNFDICRGYVDL